MNKHLIVDTQNASCTLPTGNKQERWKTLIIAEAHKARWQIRSMFNRPF